MSYTINLTKSQAGDVISNYHEYSVPSTNNYTLFRAKYNSATLTIFKTLTMIIQGSNSIGIYNEVCELLDIEKCAETKVNTTDVSLSIIGTDEVGTGDFFGPIVVAGAYVPKNKILPLMKLGVKDSKLLNDTKIQEIAPVLMKELTYSALVLDNIKYNYLTRVQQFNMNKIKALLHNNVLFNLIPKINEKYDAIIIDAFTTKEKYIEYLKDQKNLISDVELEEKGESKYIAIAAASIIARHLFLAQMDKLSLEAGFELPKGAGTKVDLAISKIFKEQPDRFLDVVGKVNFKNVEKVKKKDSH